MLLGDSHDRTGIKVLDALDRRIVAARRGRNRLERLPRETELTSPVDSRVAGQYLFEEGRSRTWQAENEDGPLCLVPEARGA